MGKKTVGAISYFSSKIGVSVYNSAHVLITRYGEAVHDTLAPNGNYYGFLISIDGYNHNQGTSADDYRWLNALQVEEYIKMLVKDAKSVTIKQTAEGTFRYCNCLSQINQYMIPTVRYDAPSKTFCIGRYYTNTDYGLYPQNTLQAGSYGFDIWVWAIVE